MSIQAYNVPTIEDFRAGKRPEWVPVYNTIFTRTDPEDREGD